MFDALGKLLIVCGVALALVGVLLVVAGKVPFLGRLPGDILVRRDNWSVYFPLTTCIVISVVLTLLLSFFGRR
jgi:formate hydrogenlyase subunit 3/multisubunit Na+/H+ antiporter MnhD subunit